MLGVTNVLMVIVFLIHPLHPLPYLLHNVMLIPIVELVNNVNLNNVCPSESIPIVITTLNVEITNNVLLTDAIIIFKILFQLFKHVLKQRTAEVGKSAEMANVLMLKWAKIVNNKQTVENPRFVWVINALVQSLISAKTTPAVRIIKDV